MTDDDLAALFKPLETSRGIVLGVSGGADSTALMFLFARWARRHPRFADSHVATVDHGLRPEAVAEAELVARQANQLGLQHITLTWTGEKPSSDIQNAARTARYKLLTDAAKAVDADTLVIAHTLEDQAETFLLALARGSGVYGLSGMPGERMLHGVRIVRPLLSLRKSQLMALLQAQNLPWSEDPSNRNDHYRRVKMRQATPLIEGLGLTSTTLAATATRLGRAASALDAYASRLITASTTCHVGGYLNLDPRQLIDEPEEVSLRTLARLLRAVSGADYNPRLERLERLLDEIRSATQSGTRLHRTLSGVIAHMPQVTRTRATPHLWLFAEAGRDGFETKQLHPGQTIDWDNRVRITLSPDASESYSIRCLGASAKKAMRGAEPDDVPVAALATHPGAWRADELIEVAGLENPPVPAKHPMLTAQSLVRDRLYASVFC